MLAPDHADRRQFRDLMTTEPAARPLLLGGELPGAPAARLRVVIDDLMCPKFGSVCAVPIYGLRGEIPTNLTPSR
jgi:hypothetical protein